MILQRVATATTCTYPASSATHRAGAMGEEHICAVPYDPRNGPVSLLPHLPEDWTHGTVLFAD